MSPKVTFGIFGKLPAKRDFIASGIPHSTLAPWEDWLQREIAASRHLLGREWVAAFLKAPIWRFWCGQTILGQAAIGIMMPSVDGVGRYFPLTILALAPPGHQFAPLGDGETGAVLSNLETHCLTALEPDAEYDTFLAGLRAFPTPPTLPLQAVEPEIFVSPPGIDGVIADTFITTEAARLLANEAARAQAVASRWWTSGGDSFPPRLLGMAGLPAGKTFAAMLTGQFDPSGEAT